MQRFCAHEKRYATNAMKGFIFLCVLVPLRLCVKAGTYEYLTQSPRDAKARNKARQERSGLLVLRGADFLTSRAIQGRGRYVGGTSLTSFAYVVLSFCKSLISMIISHDSGRFWPGKGPGQSGSVQVSPSAGLIQFPPSNASILLCVFAPWRLCVKGRGYGVQRKAPKTPRRGTKQDQGTWPVVQNSGIVRKLLNSMIIWDSSECFLRHTIPSRSCPVQVSQTIVEILGEGYDGSKKPELTWPPMPENRSKSEQIGPNRGI
jgi:hypothetical protein